MKTVFAAAACFLVLLCLNIWSLRTQQSAKAIDPVQTVMQQYGITGNDYYSTEITTN